jgi:hypothetical protein
MKDEILIGLSLSGCIKDMATGVVDPCQVKFIFAGTNWKFPEMIEEAIERYSEVFWEDCLPKAARILREFVDCGKIFQPRNYGLPAPNIAQGHWAVQTHNIPMKD